MICACHIVVNVAEIILFVVQNLQAFVYLLLQIMKTVVWLVLLCLSLATSWQEVPRQGSGVSRRLIPAVLQPVFAL